MKIKWPWGDGSTKKKGPKSINIFLGFFFIVNFCLGTGFLGIPYSFFYSGFLAAIPTLLFIAFMSWLNANYQLECMARAQALEYFEKSIKPQGQEDSDTTDSELDDKTTLTSSFIQDTSKIKDHPRFEITLKRKFEPMELCSIFFNKWAKYAYLVILTITVFLALWSYGTVAGSAWAINIPYRFGAIGECNQDDFLHQVLPPDGCRYAYYFSLFLFAVVVTSLSLIDLRETALFQLVLGLLRFITVTAILIYCIAKLAQGGEICEESMAKNPELFPNGTFVMTELRDIVVKFDVKGWLTAIPVFVYAIQLHAGISTLTHPVKQKQYLHWLLIAMFITSGIIYLSLGIVVPLWFKASIQETCTLNWGELRTSLNPMGIRVLSYYLILFPSLDVVSAYPLQVHTIVNSMYIFIMGRDTSKKSKHKYDLFLQLFLRFSTAILPIITAFGMANLIYILKYAGLFGFAICFFFPTLLQLKSIHMCKKTFAVTLISVSGSQKDGSVNGRESPPSKDVDLDSKNGGRSSPTIEKTTVPLLSILELEGKEKRSLYMTPYSIPVLSHPIFVSVMGVLGLAAFILTVASLAVHPNKATCTMPQYEL